MYMENPLYPASTEVSEDEKQGAFLFGGVNKSKYNGHSKLHRLHGCVSNNKSIGYPPVMVMSDSIDLLTVKLECISFILVGRVLL